MIFGHVALIYSIVISIKHVDIITQFSRRIRKSDTQDYI
jgi:hypothetical protein